MKTKEIVIDGVTYECTPKQEVKPIVYPDGTRVKSTATGLTYIKIDGEWFRGQLFVLNEEKIGDLYTVIRLPSTEPVLPDKWFIKGGWEIREWARVAMKQKCNVHFNIESAYYHLVEKNDLLRWDFTFLTNRAEEHKIITFDQFYNHVYLPSLKKQ
jgi:hypothetical protein